MNQQTNEQPQVQTIIHGLDKPFAVFDPEDGMHFFKTMAEAQEFAEQCIQEHLNDGFWSEEVHQIRLLQVAAPTVQTIQSRENYAQENLIDPNDIEFDEFWTFKIGEMPQDPAGKTHYELLKEEGYPATDKLSVPTALEPNIKR